MDGQYRVSPEGVRAAAGNVGGLVVQAINTALDLGRLTISPSTYGEIGSQVASADSALHGQQLSALDSLLKLLQQTNDLVKRAADGYADADAAIATGYGGSPNTGGSGSIMWPDHAANQVAEHAITDSVGGSGRPQSVATVLGYLGHDPNGSVPTDVGGFAHWLEGSPDNQNAVGVVGVYNGVARNLADVPGGVHAGDLVVVKPGSETDSMVGIAGNSGQLYNHGIIRPDFSAPATIQVYRPVSSV